MINPAVHQLTDMLRVFGLRDRLRCPKCAAVGTYKPHGGWFDGSDVRKVRRWMCKWCGHYRGPEAESQVVPSVTKECWVLKSENPSGTTPQQAVRNNPDTFGFWPWRG